MDKIQESVKPYMRATLPKLRTGDVVRVHEKIQEGDKERLQVFEGLIIARKHGDGISGTFTVRKLAARNVGVERVFPMHSPFIEKIEIVRHERVRRAKLYYVRDLIGTKAKRRKATPIDEMFSFAVVQEPPEAAETEATEAQPAEEATPKSDATNSPADPEPAKTSEKPEEAH